MHKTLPDALRTHRWRTTRNLVLRATASDRDRLLHQFGDEIRALAPLAARGSSKDWDIGACLELATALGVILGAWMTAEPANPEWPGRDRIFLARSADTLAAGAALSTFGFFQPEYAAKLVDAAVNGDKNAIPGLESVCAPTRELATEAWESGLESAWSKRRWRQHFGPGAGLDWANPEWRDAPGVWRTCIVFEHQDEAAPLCRALPEQDGECPAGLSAVIVAPQNESVPLAQQWRDSGWESMVVDRSDGPGLYNVLTAPASDKPRAIILAIGQATSLGTSATTFRLARQGTLLGELSDDQFNAIMDSTLSF